MLHFWSKVLLMCLRKEWRIAQVLECLYIWENWKFQAPDFDLTQSALVVLVIWKVNQWGEALSSLSMSLSVFLSVLLFQINKLMFEETNMYNYFLEVQVSNLMSFFLKISSLKYIIIESSKDLRNDYCNAKVWPYFTLHRIVQYEFEMVLLGNKLASK